MGKGDAVRGEKVKVKEEEEEGGGGGGGEQVKIVYTMLDWSHLVVEVRIHGVFAEDVYFLPRVYRQQVLIGPPL